MAFSDIAASEERQNQFFASLIQIMQTYNFDGVDLDWEYPRAPDRSGRDEDFKNFPVFLRRLRSALKNANSEYGISVTIPISFWYLQHFDIQSMQESVDWFNTMSYDLHGKWDLSTDYGKEHGAFLNAHTNLAEIADMLDLLWRNNINPQMVNLGARAGQCSNEPGVLLNTEIDDIIRSENLKPTLDKEAAVKWISRGTDQWVSFDDEETMRQKADFAKSLCLGGVMVWAISHDNRDGDYAHGLARAVSHEPKRLPGGAFITLAQNINSKTQANYCHWTGCGQACPSGFVQVVRGDDSKSTMTSADDCFLRTGGSRQFCCPKSKAMPKCRWRGKSKSGKCTPGCETGEVDVGSSMIGCASSGYQSACCEETESTAPYGQCKWIGDGPNCPPDMPYAGWCPSGFPTWAASSFYGPGGRPSCEVGFRTLCCKGKKPPKPFQRCEWQSTQRNLFPLSMCVDNCPQGQIQIARATAVKHSDCMLAHFQGYCCGGALDPDGDIKSRGVSNEQLLQLEFYLKIYDESPTCPVSHGPLRRAASSKGPSGLSYTSYMTLATILSSVLTVPEARPDIHKLLEAYFGYSRQVASVEELHDWARSLYDSKGFFADFLCCPIDVTTAIREANGAERVCVVPTGHIGPRDVSATEGLSEQEIGTHFNKRVFIGPYTVGSLRFESPAHPSILAALNGVVNGDLTLHYARWLAFRSPDDRDNVDYFGLEIAYWIGPTLGVVPDTAVGNRYASSRAPNARWVVFHVHFERDTYTATDDAIRYGHERGEMESFPGVNMFRRINTTSLATDNYYAGATILNVFHANRVQDFADADSRVAGEDRIGASAVNHRSTIIECVGNDGRANPRPSRWWIGAPAAEGATELESAIARFGQHLVSTGIADMASFSHIYPNGNNQVSTDRTRMPHRRFAPATREDPIFYESWVADAASVDFDDLHERVPHAATRPRYEDYRDMMPSGKEKPPRRPN